MADGVIALALVGGDDRLERELAGLAAQLGDVALLPESAAARADALLIADGQRGAALDRLRAELAARPSRRILLVGAAGAIDLADAMASGARGVLEVPLSAARLRASLAAAGCLDEAPRPAADTTGGPIVLIGAAGGCGTTTCAVALAASLEHGVLLDLDLASGDAAAVAGARVEAADALLALAYAAAVGPDELHAQLAVGSSLRVLPAPALPEQADLVDEGGVARVVDAIRQAGLQSVADAGSRVGVETLPALERASAIVIVSPTGGNGRRGWRGRRRCSSGSESQTARSASSLLACGPTGGPRRAGSRRHRACPSGPRSASAWRSRVRHVPASRHRSGLRRPRRRHRRHRMSLWERAQALAPTTSESGVLLDIAPDVLGPLLADPSVDEVLVNGPDQVWVERRGRLQRVSARFADREALRDACARLVASAGRRIDDSAPMVDARLADGSRLNVVLPPVAPDGPLLSLRRFAPLAFTLKELVERGTLTEDTAVLLARCVGAHLDVVVSGGTSTGKTSLLGALAGLVDATERVVTVEDSAELRIDRPHVVRLETRPASLEGTGAVTIRELVRNALRMRPDRLIVGEVRGGEALDLLQAMNTGHDGSLTTVHANSPAGALRRLEMLALLGGVDLPHSVVREQVASAIDVVIQLRRERDGKRIVSEVHGVQEIDGIWQLEPAELLAARLDADSA